MKNRIGIIGGGQLGRMLAFEAKKMGFYVSVIDPTPQSPAGQVVDRQIIADYNDEKAIRELAAISDFITFEIELANADLLEELSQKGILINPSAKTLTIIKDKLKQKEFLKKAGVQVSAFTDITIRDNEVSKTSSILSQNEMLKKEIIKIAKKFGYPLVLKARLDAYDGRGNALIRNEKEIEKGLLKLWGRKLYVEKFVPFVKELAVIAARSTNGEIVLYPLVETRHKDHICHTVFAPAPVTKNIQKKATNLARKVMKNLEGAGVFAIEMFLTKEGNIFVNEIAPRVHNSGHYTLEACITSQFEQHIRAITGMPLGKTNMIVPSAVMINILGKKSNTVSLSGREKALKIPYVSVHIYGKAQTKLERKMGHITAVGKTLENAYKNAKNAIKHITI